MGVAVRAWAYVGCDELEGRPHIVVDGAARAGTSLVLSHWPASPTPPHLARDLSAEIARDFLSDESSSTESSELVTNDHLDLDGLVSLFFLTSPAVALGHAEVLVEVARIGDFGVVRSMDAARCAWALETLMRDPHLGTVELVESAINENSTMTHTYRALLAVLPRYLTEHDRFRHLYEHREARYRHSVELLERDVRHEEVGELDLAVFEAGDVEAGEEGVESVTLGLDPLAIHSATDASRILISRAGRFSFYDRYETWVRYVSRRRLLRRDMQPLASALSDADASTWSADPPSAIEPSLRSAEESTLSAAEVLDRLTSYLSSAPAAFDPFGVAPFR